MLAIALAAGAFKDYSTIEEILAVCPAPDMDYALLEWKHDMLDRPFFQTMNSAGPTGKIVSSSSFDNMLGKWSTRAGFERAIKIHDARREALIKADGMYQSLARLLAYLNPVANSLMVYEDNGYSPDERMKFAGQRNPNTFRQSYMAAMSTLDGQGSFLGTELRKDQGCKQSATISHNRIIVIARF